MPTPAAIVEELDALLDAPSFGDWCLNGLQVPGEREVQRVVTGVSANHALLEAAAASGADLVLVHHGLFWGAGVRAIDPVLHQRLALLYGSGIALAAYHLPLDADPVFGNNALLARALGATPAGMFAPSFEKPIGVVAELAPVAPEALASRLSALLAREPQMLGRGPAEVTRVAILTGAGAGALDDAARAGAQALITGELSERSPALAAEMGLHLIGAGHHATERLGVRALGDELARRHGIEHRFIEIDNPL